MQCNFYNFPTILIRNDIDVISDIFSVVAISPVKGDT